MAFTGKAVYEHHAAVEADGEDLSELVGIVSVYETPLLDHLGDPPRAATTQHHEWLEDNLKDALCGMVAVRVRMSNHTVEFSADVAIAVADDGNGDGDGDSDALEYRKQQCLRELLRQLESAVVNGQSPLKGIVSSMPYAFRPGIAGVPAGQSLTEDQLALAIRRIGTCGSGRTDTIVVGGVQKRRINTFTNGCHESGAEGIVSLYESEHGICRVILSRAVPADTVLLLDSSRISVVPLAGRGFRYQPAGKNDGRIVGEYTLELRNESAHGMISGLGVQ